MQVNHRMTCLMIGSEPPGILVDHHGLSFESHDDLILGLFEIDLLNTLLSFPGGQKCGLAHAALYLAVCAPLDVVKTAVEGLGEIAVFRTAPGLQRRHLLFQRPPRAAVGQGVGIANEADVNAAIEDAMPSVRKKKVVNACPFDLPKKFWAFLLARADVPAEAVWLDLGKKAKNKLIITLLNDVYEVRGKTTFKEEFVTCGGVVLSEVDFNTMQSRVVPGLYFAGEVLDVDGVTGGFNFQAAWTTGFVAGRLG